jgi:hypothetical protein
LIKTEISDWAASSAFPSALQKAASWPISSSNASPFRAGGGGSGLFPGRMSLRPGSSVLLLSFLAMINRDFAFAIFVY